MIGQPVAGLPDFFDPLHFAKLDGTNAEAKRRAAGGAAEGLLLTCDEQEAGRGRSGRVWESPPGNLYCSILLRPREAPDRAALLSFVAALAVRDLVTAFCGDGEAVGLKWPNDVLVNGKKIAGILLESAARADGMLDWLVVGMGVNLAHYPEATETAATSLAEITGKAPQASEARDILAGRFLHYLKLFRREGFEPVRQAWLQGALGLGQEIRVRLPNETLYGHFRGLDEGGHLLLQTGEEVRPVSAGEVFFDFQPQVPSEA